jgi:riboflavin synthase
MFTGLVETTGEVIHVAQQHAEKPRRLRLRSALPGQEIALGDSVAVDGCCLTVVQVTPCASSKPARHGSAETPSQAACELDFEAASETLARTSIGTLAVGHAVNLERSLRMGDRLGGHLVSGHVDAVCRITAVEQRHSALYLSVALPAELHRFVSARGSITLAGVSLTLTQVAQGTATVALIPHTLQRTTLKMRQVGEWLNVEVDMLARYVDTLLHAVPVPQLEATG